MDTTIEQQEQSVNQRDVKKRFFGIAIFEFVYIIIIFIILFGTLNFFNLISISRLFPRIFGGLPHQEFKNQAITIKQSPLSNICSSNIELPIDTKTDKAINVTVDYTFIRRIENIQQISGRQRITVSITPDKKQSFDIDAKTIIYNAPSVKKFPESFYKAILNRTPNATLNVNDNAAITAVYLPYRARWGVVSVGIIANQ